jgi:TIR domain
MLAEFLRSWLPRIHPAFTTVWVDRDAIKPGQPWSPALDRGLAESHVGVVCITPENATAPWPIAEFVCLSKDGKPVIPLLVGGATDKVLAGPMQATQFALPNYQGTWELLKALAAASGEAPDLQTMERQFQRHWPELKQFLDDLGPNPLRQVTLNFVGSWASILSGVLWMIGAAREKPDSFTITSVGRAAARVAAVLALLLLTSLGALAYAPAVGEWVAKAVVATSSGARDWLQKHFTPPPANDAANRPAGPDLSRELAAQTQLANRLRETNAQLTVAQSNTTSSNTVLVSLVHRLQEHIRYAETNDTNWLSRLPADEANLVNLVADPGQRPALATNDWILFIPTGATATSQLYRDAAQNEPFGRLEFGIPYKVLAVMEGVSTQVQLTRSGLALVYELFKGCLRTGSRPTSCSFGAYALKR